MLLGFATEREHEAAAAALGEFKVRIQAVAHEQDLFGLVLFEESRKHGRVRFAEAAFRFYAVSGLQKRHKTSDIGHGAVCIGADEVGMRDPERDLALHTERKFAKFAIIKTIMIGNKYQLGVLDIGTQVQRRILRGKPFCDFGVCEEEHVLDAFFVNGVERKVQSRNNGIVGQREPHDLEAVFVEDRRLAGIVAQIVDRHLLGDAANRLDRLRVGAATQVQGSVEVKYDSFYRGALRHVPQNSKRFYLWLHEDTR